MEAQSPIAGRLRRPGWKDPRLLIGLLLMAVAIVGVTGIVRSADQTSPHYVARETLTPGTVLEVEDLAIAHVRIGGGAYVPAGDAEAVEPWGQVVTRVIEEGELVPAAALADEEAFDGRPVAVVTTAPVAEDVRPGSLVDLWVTQMDGTGQPDSSLVGEGLVVADVETDEGAFASGGAATVYVVVSRDALGDFLEALAVDGEVSVVGLAGGE